MPRKESKLRPDVNELAFRTVQAATGQGDKPKVAGRAERNATAVKRGRQGGRKGGPARKAKLTPEQRTAIAKTAAAARWRKHRSP